MRFKKIILFILGLSSPLFAAQNKQIQLEIQQLQVQAKAMQAQLAKLQKKLQVQNSKSHPPEKKTPIKKAAQSTASIHEVPAYETFHSTQLTVHTPEAHPESICFYPTALVADDRVVTYIAGTPVVTSPYLGDRPAFDGSDYIVNISSINRDIRLMQQRRRLYRAYMDIGYPAPQMPILALSGKSEPNAMVNSHYNGNISGDLTLGSSELDVAAALNQNVEAYIALAYDESPPSVGPRINNSAFNLNMGFVNIGNLDKTPFYFTAGQLFVPFGRYASSMISAPLTLNLARTKTRPFILGYKSQEDPGPFAAIYGYRSDTTLGKAGVGGVNLGYIFKYGVNSGEIGASYISSLADAAGMQSTGSKGTTFGGFGSITNGNEFIRKTPAFDVHANFGYGPFNFAAEWVGVTQAFRAEDLSYNGQGAKPQAGQAEINTTFTLFDRPSSLGAAYQWTNQALALNLSKQRLSAVFNISIWKDTIESLEYRHDIDYNTYQFASGAAPFGQTNSNTYGTGQASNSILAQIGVYF
ncbi:MAG: LbtU family siderophore porin [Legionella sp.]|nr:LbtU family siderophore porin [Legionella sp.]